jgi:heme/copper-type cytochrome/quinol oxidase subunit 4
MRDRIGKLLEMALGFQLSDVLSVLIFSMVSDSLLSCTLTLSTFIWCCGGKERI